MTPQLIAATGVDAMLLDAHSAVSKCRVSQVYRLREVHIVLFDAE